jgi:antitoxin component of RelBE/YafQ-DinJ toxin-antitoxin module
MTIVKKQNVITVRVHDTLKTALSEIADKQSVSVSKLIEEILAKNLQVPFDNNYYHAGSDVHNMTYRGTPKKRRAELNTGDIYTNAAICHCCGWFIRSKNRHDYVTCKCGAVSVDGGSWYAKRSFKDPSQYTNVIEYYDDVKSEEAATFSYVDGEGVYPKGCKGSFNEEDL